MKKKVIAVLLASMMATSMVPVTAMAEDQPDVVSAEETQDLSEDTETEDQGFFEEETDVQEAETKAPAEEESQEEDSRDAVELEKSEDADSLDLSQNTLESDSDEADPFGLTDGTAPAAEAAGTVTLNGVAFDTSKTYIVPLTLKNAHNLEQDSAAVACPGKFGTLTFDADGTPKLSTNLRSVTVGTLTDYAYNFKVYQGVKPSGTTVDADVAAAQNVPKADGSGNHEVPETISFAIPKDTFVAGGVYLSMYVDAMGYAPDAYLQIDYAGAKESGDPSLNFTTEVSTAEVEQFGNYNVTSQVTVKDGRITDVSLAGNDFKGTHADDNQMYLNKAINGLGSTKGMKEKLTGLYMNDAQKLNDLDTVSGATYSSNAIKNATMNALGVKIEQEVIPDAPTEKPAPGLYYIEMKDRTDVVDHGLVGESKKVGAYLRVDNDGKMWLTYKMVSGTTGEPLYVLGYNGYYPNGDTTQPLTKEGVTYSTESTTAPTIGDCTVVTDITVPLDSISQTYVNNVYLYVEAMKNLNGEVSGVYFDAGKFNINSTITLYWDTLYNLSEDSGAAELAKLSDGVYKLSGEMVKVNKVDMSMSNNAINHNIKLVVKNGVPYVNMNFNSLTITSLKGYLKDLNYYASGYEVSKTGEPSGTLVPVTVNSLQKFSNGKTLKDDFGTDYPNDISFPLCEEALEGNNEIPLQVFVPIMDAITPGSGKQNVYLRLDYSTLKETTDADADFAETEKAPTDPSTIKKQAAQSITVAVKNTKNVVSKKYGDKAFSLGAKAKTAMTYKSSNTKVATVDSKGKVTIKAAGTAKITITAKATSSYKAATKTLTVKVAKAAPVLKTKITSKNVSYSALRKKAQVFTLGASVSSKGTLTYAKTAGSSAFTVNKTNGKITVKKGLKKGTYKIKVKISAKATANYNAGTKTVLVTVRVK
ncbi:NEAT domain-containing protein [Blautia schinkii]|uniref:NEAT domain-containing protein n=1 Tax=Blautia schinkii TaxID=180164 RepID=UPI00156EFBE8|nr:NEAT domain-containing protein [Blautia schinkii]NSK34213.1 FMN-binding protein [Blautia schinkii]NSK64857.1 FMN-binding protein [Blautia schinkii]